MKKGLDREGGGREGGRRIDMVTPKSSSHLQLAERCVHHVFYDTAHHGAGRQIPACEDVRACHLSAGKKRARKIHQYICTQA